jgi:hypothetical protein
MILCQEGQIRSLTKYIYALDRIAWREVTPGEYIKLMYKTCVLGIIWLFLHLFLPIVP